MLSQPTAIVLLVKLKLSHKSGKTADTLTALLMSSAKKAFASRCCLDIPATFYKIFEKHDWRLTVLKFWIILESSFLYIGITIAVLNEEINVP